MKYIWLLILMLGVPLLGQQRYLVTSKDEVIPVRKGESAAQLLGNRVGAQPSIAANATTICSNRFTFGFPEEIFVPNVNIGAYHKDVMAEWLVVPASGTIDTIFWEVLGSVGALDSTIFLNVHKSRIGPTYGPGANGSVPFRAPCQSWGYFINSNDCDGAIAPFLDDATDTNWVSKVQPGMSIGNVQSESPAIGYAIWGAAGAAHVEHAGSINFVSMYVLDTLRVSSGDVIFISMKVKGPVCHTIDDKTEFAATGFRVTLDDENYPSHFWKFYEHDSGPQSCSGALAPKGWYARGGFSDDSLDVAVINWWYTTTVTSNIPPFIESGTVLHTTFSNGPFPVEAQIADCDPLNPGHAGIETAKIEWYVNNVSQPAIIMNSAGGDTWQGIIPPQPFGSSIRYKISASDSSGLLDQTIFHTFRVVQMTGGFYFAETSASCISHDISATGTQIPNGSFFLPPTAPSGTFPTDEGTAGPFILDHDMMIFGDDNRYVWVGINGAIALSKTATDTLDVNSNGIFGFAWTLPYGDTLRVDREISGSVMERMPVNFMALLSHDFMIADTFGNQFGHILYQQLSGDDSCLFVVQWDSVGTFLTGSTVVPNPSKIRIVLNQCDGTIEYQYDYLGYLDLDSTSLVGMQGRTNTLHTFVNEGGYPLETRPRDNWCVKFYPSTPVEALDSWNLVSVCVYPVSGDYSQAACFPMAQGPMYSYQGVYTEADPLVQGRGYWAKLPVAGQLVGAYGALLSSLNIPVVNGWNMIGGIGHQLAASSVGIGGGGSLSSGFFGYGETGYEIASAIVPGYGYWVRMTGAGTLSLNYSSAIPKQSPSGIPNALNKIAFIDATGRQQTLYIGEETVVKQPLDFYGLPPAAPGFDVRYLSGRMVETYPVNLSDQGKYEYTIMINEAVYPLTILWEIVKPASNSLVLTNPEGKLGNTVMNGSGSIRLTDASMKSVVVKLADVQVPTEYALGQNYPNPFNPTTRFEVAIPKTAYVTVAIYDVLGRQITTLMSGQQGAGYYTMEWDGRDARGLNVPTGIYFIRMRSDEFNQTQKIMLMK